MRKLALWMPLCFLIVAGCKSGPSFVGTWTVEGGSTAGISPTVTLNADKTMTLTGANGQIKATGKGTWTVNDKEFTETLTDLKLDGLPPGMDKIVQSTTSTILNKPQSGAFTWKSDDEFSVKRENVEVTFKRKK